jgi:hypothetical protein
VYDLPKNLSRTTCVRGSMVVMQSPGVKFPFLWPPAENGDFQSLQNFNIVMLIHLSTFGDVCVVNTCHRIIFSAVLGSSDC